MNWPLAQRNAIKTALGVTLAYCLALSLGWQNPVWAAFGVYIPRLPYFGMTLHKCLLRVAGTFFGAGVAIAILGLSAQDQWVALAGISLATGLWFFLTRRTADSYAFMVAGFTGYIVWSSAIFEPYNAFTVASYRISETCLGIVVGALVSGLLWPTPERPAIRQQMEALRRTLIAFSRQMADAIEGDANAKAGLGGTVTRLNQLSEKMESLFISANRNTFTTQWLRTMSGVFVNAQELIEHLDGLRSLLRQYPRLSESRSATAVADWIRECATALDRMNWAEIESATIDETSLSRYRDDVDRAISIALHDEERGAGEVTLAVAARDQLRSITADVVRLAERLADIQVEDFGNDTQNGRIVGAAAPIEPVRADVRHSIVTVLSMFAAGAFWFTVYIPAGGSLFQFAGTIQIILLTAPVFPYRLFFGILLGTIIATFPVVFLLLPRLDGIVELSMVIFVAVYLFALVQEMPGKQFLGLLGFATFAGMLMIQPQQANASTQLPAYINAAIAQVVGGHISLIVSKLLIPTSGVRQLIHSVQRVLQCAGRLLGAPADDSSESNRESFGRERQRLLTACDQMVAWQRRVVPSLSELDAQAVTSFVHELQVTAMSLVAVESFRLSQERGLSEHGRVVERELRQLSIVCFDALHAAMNSHSDVSAPIARLKHRVDEIADRARNLAQDATSTQMSVALSMVGHYQALAAALVTLSTALEECDVERLTQKRF